MPQRYDQNEILGFPAVEQNVSLDSQIDKGSISYFQNNQQAQSDPSSRSQKKEYMGKKQNLPILICLYI